jgi:NAD(P)-dependent dehydrogenase (short-subunit alcohol dehydrogenase family)
MSSSSSSHGMRFSGRVAFITGAAGAIGRATAERLAAERASLFLVDRDAATLAQVAETFRDAGAPVEHFVADLTADAAAGDAVEAAQQAYGRIDVAALIAGMAAPRRVLWEMPIADWDLVIATNLRTMFLTLRATLANMVANGVAGSIVTMSSSHALWDVHDGGAAYSTSKGGVLSLTRVAAFDAAKHGIRVNAVAPGVIQTPLGLPAKVPGLVMLSAEQRAARIPLKRLGRPHDVAAFIAFLASDDAAHVTGSVHLIDAGQTLQSWANSPEIG